MPTLKKRHILSEYLLALLNFVEGIINERKKVFHPNILAKSEIQCTTGSLEKGPSSSIIATSEREFTVRPLDKVLSVCSCNK